MTIARKAQISLEETPFYHCYVRCVRRAFLCGDDDATGENYDHRKQWIVSRLRFLSYVYAIDICAYTVLSNHYHVVLHVDQARAEGWSREEVTERWMQLYSGHTLVNRWLAQPESMDEASLAEVNDIIEEWRVRLHDIGWFMRGVNETIARMANEEENCKGRFWEGRYKSQALLDEAALLSCMTYVDLNPIRAGMADNLQASDFTSIQRRLFDYARETKQLKDKKTLKDRVRQQDRLTQELGLTETPEAPLMPLDGSSHPDISTVLPFTEQDYFDLVDKTGRLIREDKRGFIPAEVPPLIQQFGIDPSRWIDHIKHLGRHYAHCVGSVDKIKAYAGVFKKQWAKGVANSASLYVA